MILSPIQRRGWPLVTQGTVTDLLNARPDIFNAYHPLPLPTLLATTGRHILGIDRRDDTDYVISADTGRGFLYLEGILEPDGSFSERGEMICGDIGSACAIAACGRFLLVRRNDSSLYFLRWDSDTSSYTALGTMPADISFAVEREELAPSIFAIEAVKWPKAVDDLRQGVTEEVARLTGNVVKRSWQAAVEACTAMDALLQPVTVRVAARLFDGSLYCVSEPVRVPGAQWKGGERFMLPVEFDGNGAATGTKASSFSLTPYRIKVTAGESVEPLWNDVFSAVEIYVEPERDAIGGSECQVSYIAQSRGLSVFLPMHPSRELEQWLGTGPWRMAYRSALPLPQQLLLGAAAAAPVVDLDTLPPHSGHADTLLPHGAFLHMASGGELTTSLAGNPMAVCSRTRFGSRIRAMAAMPSGGGAYTRQYIYVCTESAIFALTCDSAGRHTNCRPVSPHTVSDTRRLVSTDDCVYALTDSGCLMRLRNARPEILYRGLPPFMALLWDAETAELWLVSGDDGCCSLVIQTVAPQLAFRRDIAATAVVPQSGRILYCRGDMFCQARSQTSFGDDIGSYAPAMVRMRLPAPVGEGKLMKLRGAVAAPASMRLTLKAESETLVSASTSGAQLDDDMLAEVASTNCHWLLSGRRQYLLPFAGVDTGRLGIGDTLYDLTMEGRWTCAETPFITMLAATASPDGTAATTSAGDRACRKDAPSRARIRKRPGL